MRDRLYDHFTFETMDIDNGWFVAQVTSIIQKKYTHQHAIGLTKYDFVVGFINKNNIKLYDTKQCATNSLANEHGLIFENDSSGRVTNNLKSLRNYSEFPSFIISCINNVINKDLDKYIFIDLTKID